MIRGRRPLQDRVSVDHDTGKRAPACIETLNAIIMVCVGCDTILDKIATKNSVVSKGSHRVTVETLDDVIKSLRSCTVQSNAPIDTGDLVRLRYIASTPKTYSTQGARVPFRSVPLQIVGCVHVAANIKVLENDIQSFRLCLDHIS